MIVKKGQEPTLQSTFANAADRLQRRRRTPNLRELIESTVEGGGEHPAVSYEAWIAADPFRGGMRVLITGPQGFERVVQFDADEQPAEITRRVRETLDE